MGCAKKPCEDRYILVKERGATCILFNSICAVVLFFISGVRIKEIDCLFFILTLPAEKSAFFRVVLYKIGKKLSPLKLKKYIEKS